MAVVPIVTQRQVLPSDQGLPYSDPSAGFASNTAVNKALFQAGSQVQEGTDYLVQAMDKLQVEDDKREFRKLDTEYSAYVRLLTYGDGTAENPGFLNQKGENAIAAYKGAQTALQKKQTDLTKLASNVHVKDMFTTTATDRYDSTMSTYLNHTADERQKANDAVSQARVDEAIMDAASNWANPQATERNLAIVQGEIADAAVRNGLPKEAAQAAFKKASNDLLERTITAAAITSPGAATALLAKYGAEMDGFTVAAMKEKIHSQVMQNVSDNERFEAIKDRNKAREERATFADRYSKYLQGQLTAQQLVEDSKAGAMEPSQIDFLTQRMVKAEKVTGNDLLYNRTKFAIADGTITDLAQIQNGDFSDKQMDDLTNRLLASREQDPVLQSYADRQAINDIKVKITGPVTFDNKFYDPAGPERANNAYDTFVQLRHNGKTTQDALSYVIQQYRPRDVPLSTLAKPSQWQGSWADTGNKDEFYAKLQATVEATKSAYNNHQIDETQFNLEMEELKYLSDVLTNLSDEYPVIQGNQ